MREYLLTLFVTAAVTYLLTGAVRRFAIAAGAMPEIRARDVHKEPTPRLGGLAMFGGLCAGLLISRHLPGMERVFTDSSDVQALMSGCALICLLGVIDDKWGVDAIIKLLGQALAAGIMVWQGIVILWLPIPGHGTYSLSPTQGAILTIAVVVITINAVNFVDGLDGLAAGMVCIGALAFFVYAYRLWFGYGIAEAAAPTMFTALLIGMCAGFLPHNLHPARIFMGDSGSMLIGLMLSAAAITLTGRIDPETIADLSGSQTFATHKLVPVYIPLILPFAVLIVPLLDLVMAVTRRGWAGRSPFAADKGHLHHRLLEIGHSHSRAVLIMYFWSGLIASFTVLISVRPARRPIVYAGLGFIALGLIVLLLPWFRPNVPKWLYAAVPPRYRGQGRRRASTEAEKDSDIAPESLEQPWPAPESDPRPVAGSGSRGRRGPL
ncbi:MraY family glycosyltransferase [Yinghuangia soli]|uniref:Undecaprenyl/decaprenyl-phosphate alpha-N-acetylglucosaminyl 1-phosphate transferase n=1 Tax=Yinghuangia soli TaxID=2908204 RepID=A0AA41U338_9ACTN|nr:MraY family glycosyltransferase [Yinghuangia soli]MCF2531346.1 undecaprenyl/decaprenyl-phosphate alpha-N-acetylglucosaminyl 1-phosphate transferase [Yinghuangia soli]